MKTQKKILSPFFLFVVCAAMCFSCQKDNEKQIYRNIKGVIEGVANCNLKPMAMTIKLENFKITLSHDGSQSDRIIAANVPDEFQKHGLEIIFDMKKRSIEDGSPLLCVGIYSPDIFYTISNIKTTKK